MDEQDILRPADVDLAVGIGGRGGDVKPPPPGDQEQAIVWITSAVGGMVLVIATAIAINRAFSGPVAPSVEEIRRLSVPTGGNVAGAKEAIEIYRDLCDVHNERCLKFFTTVVGSSFLPLPTTLIGYIVGAQKDKAWSRGSARGAAGLGH